MFNNADAYQRFMGRWSRMLAPRLADLADFPDGGRVLDVGSGTGSLAFAVAERKPALQLVGIDRSAEYVAYANARNPFPERVSFQVADARQLQFRDAAFSACGSLLAFNLIPDPGRALDEVRRVTRPGGRIAAAVWDYGEGMRMLRTFWDAVVSIRPQDERLDERHMMLCGAGELSRFWKQAGLENVEERALEITLRFESFADYWDAFLLGQGPAGSYARSLDPELLTVLRQEVQRRLPVAAADLPFALPARAWAVRGRAPGD